MSLLFPAGEWFEENHAKLYWQPGFFDSSQASIWCTNLLEQAAWQQGQIQLWGKTLAEPRLSSFYGDHDVVYQYSGRLMRALPWLSALETMKKPIEALCQHTFNAAFCNLYRNGQDAMGWHSDDEPVLGRQPVIASVSFGQTRRFLLRHKQHKTLQHEFLLGHGDLLIMAGDTQRLWQHSVAKTTKSIAPRINITFRHIHR